MSTSRTSHARRVIRAGRLQLPRPRGAALLQPGALTAACPRHPQVLQLKGAPQRRRRQGGTRRVQGGREDGGREGRVGFKAHKQMVRPRPAVAGEPGLAGGLAAHRSCDRPTAGQAAFQEQGLQGDDGGVQVDAHLHQVRARPKSPAARSRGSARAAPHTEDITAQSGEAPGLPNEAPGTPWAPQKAKMRSASPAGRRLARMPACVGSTVRRHGSMGRRNEGSSLG